jgi:hypothetical protein
MSKKTKSNEANEYRYKYITISGYSDESEISSHALVFMSIPVRGGKIKNISISQSITTDKTLLKKQLTRSLVIPLIGRAYQLFLVSL